VYVAQVVSDSGGNRGRGVGVTVAGGDVEGVGVRVTVAGMDVEGLGVRVGSIVGASETAGGVPRLIWGVHAAASKTGSRTINNNQS